MQPKYLTVQAHGRDCNDIAVIDAAGEEIFHHDGYIPHGLKIGGGDDVYLTIDIETGKIVDWDAFVVRRRIQELMEEGHE